MLEKLQMKHRFLSMICIEIALSFDLFNFSIVISSLVEQNKKIAQKLAIMEMELTDKNREAK